MKEGEFLRRWEELRSKWKYWIPTITIDTFIRQTLKEAREEYPRWKECVEDVATGEEGVTAVIKHLKRIWAWIFRWWL